MMSYDSFISYLHNNHVARENTEWSNFWYEDSNSVNPKRILLVGDSTARMVRRSLQKKLSVPVDLFATSSGLHDVLFCSQINSFFSNGRTYDVVYVQLGNHSRINDKGESYNDKDYEVYKADLLALNRFLHQYCKNVIFATVFECVKPVGRWLFLLEQLTRIKFEKSDETINSNTRRKNAIIEECANICSNGECFLDINGLMKNHKFFRSDHIHFEKRAVPVIVNYMCKVIKDLL